ncbi:MAG TPA: acyl-CoA reductase [Ferruginibacter sp.]|nr:acyl-CoA reductase [Chitinophagaceae bacterium]HRI26079.1 acyl-CoA reductase [Ferruginibacter sp.]
MNLQNRIQLLLRLGNYLQNDPAEWQVIKKRATVQNGWFTPGFIDLAVKNICSEFLQKEKLEQWAAHYHLDDNIGGKNTGIVMAGNIPLVGFHDFLCVFISGHRQTIKLSTKDDVLLKHLVNTLIEWEPSLKQQIVFADMLRGCDAYIATGSNNSARYFEQYFSKYPHIIRRNRTSVAVISGDETAGELSLLSDDIHQYFGLGCRNTTRLLVPEGYDFVPMLKAFNSYQYFSDHHKFKNNYDYQLSILLMNKIYYMTNGSTLLVESNDNFSAISRVNYSYYKPGQDVLAGLKGNDDIQCITGKNVIPFGEAQKPRLTDYADGVDTMQFLLSL